MTSTSQPYLTTLTPLRGIAALLVVIFHCNLIYRPFVPPGYTKFVENGWLWVDFFFILSGFIMFYAYGNNFKNRVVVADFKKYMGARFSRIYPLYFFTTIWTFLSAAIIVHLSTYLDPFNAEIFDLKGLPACLLLVQSMHIGYFVAPLNGPAWSLSTEWWAYVIFPFFVPLFIRLGTMGKIIALLLVTAGFIAIRYLIGPISWGTSGPSINIISDYGFLRCLAGFFTGMLLYVFYARRSGFHVIKKSWFFLLFFFAALVAMHFNVMDIIIVAIFPFIILSAAYNDSFVKRILDTKVLQRLGDWSFAIYMVHVPIITMFITRDVINNHDYIKDLDKLVWEHPDYKQGLWMCLLILTLTLILSALVYRFVEVPSRNFLNRVFKTKQRKILADGVEV